MQWVSINLKFFTLCKSNISLIFLIGSFAVSLWLAKSIPQLFVSNLLVLGFFFKLRVNFVILRLFNFQSPKCHARSSEGNLNCFQRFSAINLGSVVRILNRRSWSIEQLSFLLFQSKFVSFYENFKYEIAFSYLKRIKDFTFNTFN